MPATDADAETPDGVAPGTDVDQLLLFPPPSASPSPTRSTATVGFVVAAVAAVLFAVLSVFLAVVIVRDRGKADTSADRTEISTTAARLAEAITAMDGSGNGTQAATVQQLGTAPVVSQYQEISGAIRKVMGPLKLTSIRGTVKEVYVGNVEDAESRVVVRLDLVYVGDNTRVIPDQYLDMTLAKLNGVWKVDNVEVLNVALAGGNPTTTTTAPAGSSSS